MKKVKYIYLLSCHLEFSRIIHYNYLRKSNGMQYNTAVTKRRRMKRKKKHNNTSTNCQLQNGYSISVYIFFSHIEQLAVCNRIQNGWFIWSRAGKKQKKKLIKCIALSQIIFCFEKVCKITREKKRNFKHRQTLHERYSNQQRRNKKLIYFFLRFVCSLIHIIYVSI